jgi:hypothetical protein
VWKEEGIKYVNYTKGGGGPCTVRRAFCGFSALEHAPTQLNTIQTHAKLEIDFREIKTETTCCLNAFIS